MKTPAHVFVRRAMIMTATLISVSAFAATPAAGAHKKHAVLEAGTPPDVGPVMTGEEFDKAVQEANVRGVRNTASADVNMEAALSDSFRNIRNEIIGGPKFAGGKETGDSFPGIKTPAQLHELLTRLNDDQFYATLSPDAQYAAAQMAPFIAARGLFNRSIELINPSPISHMAVVGALRALSSSIMVYIPTAQWQAGMEYMILPFDGMKIISTEDDLHRYIESELLPVLAKSVTRIEKLNFASKPIYFDNKVFYGTANYVSEQDRYVRVGEAERRIALASTYSAMSGLESLNAYQLNGLFATIDAIAKSAGYSSAFGFNPDGTQAKRRFDIIRAGNASYGLFNLRPNGGSWMTASYRSLTGAIANSILAWHELKAHGNDNTAMGGEGNPYGVVFDPRAVMGPDRILTISSANMKYIITGAKQQQIQSAVVSTEGRQIALHNFFANPPKSLINLMPYPPGRGADYAKGGFDISPYNNTMVIDGKPRVWHNYLAGRPVSWPLAEYQKIFPEIQKNSDIPFTARVLSQTWGGWVIGLPMSAMVL